MRLSLRSAWFSCVVALVSPGMGWAAPEPAGKLPTGKSVASAADAAATAAKGSEKADPAPSKSDYKLPDKIAQLFQDQNYEAALKALDEAAAEANAPRDYLAFMRARALHLQQKYDDAVAAYQALEKDHPKSPWARRARFAAAVSLARKGDFRSAEEIYREQASRLLSADRKQEIADLYLEFADLYFKPKDELQHKPDYAKALEFYKKALEVGPKPDKHAEVELRIGRCFQLLGNHQEAANAFAKFLKDHPLPEKAPDRSAGAVARDIEARFRLGEAQLALNQREEARRTWQDLLAQHPDAAQEQIAEAQFNLSLTYGMPTPGSKEELELGVGALEAFAKKYPAHKLAPQAHLRIAQAYMHLARNADAAKTVQRFLADPRYADKDESADAQNLLGKALQLQKKYSEALAAWRAYLTKHPAHSAWSEVQRQIIDTEYLIGAEQRAAKKYDEARKLWTEFMAKYPLDARSASILLQFGQMNFEQEKWDEAIADWRRVVSKYPNTNESSQAQYLVAATLEAKLGKLEEALAEYKKVTAGPFAPQAQVSIGRLTAKSFSIATERVFRSDETPRIKLTSRNIETLTVRAFRVDLETYFRKMHDIGGIEGLDISLIDPDRTFEFKVPKYAEHQQLESEIEVPLPKSAEGEQQTAGVMAVTVSSKTIEATTLVLQSDLDIVVKSSRDEVFVFAENMRNGKPWPKARLLISNGQQVFAEAATGDDGVFKQSYKELKAAGDVRVFAIAEGSVASNVVSLDGVGAAQGLADKGYLYTDRPAYRAGQIVHVRGIVRRALDDAFTIDKGKKYTLEIFDTRNRAIWQEEVALSDYGSFRSLFTLPATSPPGTYRVAVRDVDGRGHEGSFVVQEYRLDSVRLSVETERKVFYRGEEIEGKIVARFYYGAPLAQREIRYQLGNGRSYSGITDAKGEVKFKLPTRDFRETQVLPLIVQLPERNLSATQNFFLAAQGFTLSLSTPRPVYVAGEPFEVSVKALDAEGKPIAHKIALSVIEQTTVDGKVGEREIDKFELSTAAKDGIARKSLVLDKGANYVLRAAGIDRFQNPITGERVVQISDDKDGVRLRILADQHTFKVGDTAEVRLHWRESPALALVTFQGAKVLHYQLVQLETGVNPLPIPLGAKLAPNFELSVAVMTDPRDAKQPAEVDADGAAAKKPVNLRPKLRFHEAASFFTVSRDLKVTLETRRKGDAKGAIRPGEELQLVVKATDPQGKPAVAELSVAMVEQSLLAMFGNPVGRIDEFFQGAARSPAVRTSSSVTFAYRPAARSIDKQLLAEEERKEIAAEEAARLAATDPFGDVVGSPIDRTAAVEASVALAFDADGAQVAQSDLGLENSAEVHWSDANGSEMAYAVDGSPAQRQIALNGSFNSLMLGRPVISPYLNATGKQSQARTYALPVKPGDSKQNARNANPGGPNIVRGINKPEDFNSLIDLITPTIAPTTWEMVADPLNSPDAQARNGELLKRRNDVDVGRQVMEVNLFSINNSLHFGMKDLVCVNGRGEQFNINFRNSLGDSLAAADVQRFASDLARSGALLVASQGPQETGYWMPSVITDANGEATLTITVPEQSTAWKITAKGITQETLAGEAETDFAAKKDLFGEIRLPAAFTDGDDAEVLVTIHNDLLEQGSVQVALRTILAGRTVEEKKTIDVSSKGLHELSFKTSVRRPSADQKNQAQPAKDDPAAKTQGENEGKQQDTPDLVAFELIVTSGDQRDSVRRVVPIRPFGVPVYAAAGGSAESDATIWVEPPKDMPLNRPALEVVVGPTVERSLLDIVLGAAHPCQLDSFAVASGLDVATSDLMSAVALQKLLSATRDANHPQGQALDARIRSALGQIVSSQQDDGGWSWSGHGKGSHRFTSARALWALSLAKGAGYKIADDSFQKAVTYVQSQIATTTETDFESKAILLHALATVGQGDFTLANRLHRNKPSLSNSALAHLALAFVEMDRLATAKELLADLGERNLDILSHRRASPSGALPWNTSTTELRALYALGLQRATPESPKTREQIDWLMAHRTGHRWTPEKATGPASLAVAGWYGKSRFDGGHYKLTVFVNDLQVQTLDITAESDTQTVAVPSRMLKPGKQRINFQLTGRGRYTYQAILGGFVPADKLKNTTQDWQVRRTYEPAPLEFDGQVVPRGFDVLQGSYSVFRNPLTQLPVGKRGQVELQIWRHNLPANTPEEQLEYLVVTEPLPSGATVIENSIAGGFERFELGAGTITFYVGSRQYVEPIRFDVHGYVPGDYKAAPTMIRNAYRPDQLAVSEVRSLAVLPLGGVSKDEYRLSPRELYEFGKRKYAKQDLAGAGPHLIELLAKWNVNADVYKDSARMLLDVHLATGPAGEVVRYFEIIKEKWPDLEIPFDKIMKVAAAYHDLGEYERSYLVYRATVESSFIRENAVAGFLEAQGEFLRSVDVMNRLLAEYPPEPYAAATAYALAQRVYSKAPQAAADPKLREKKINRVVLIQQALAMLDNFLTFYPDDPAADQASFSLANALLELKAYKEAIARTAKFAERFKTSDFLDSYWYIAAYGHFALGEHEQALALAKRVADHKRTDKQSGREVESPNKWQAIYIMGQVFHSLGKAAEAIAEYTRVEDRFRDAKEAIAYFLRKEIALPEVTAFKPNEPATVELKFRNVPTADIKVYRIDLMKFSLLKRNLGGIAQINLSGIRPFFEKTFELGDGKDYRDRSEKLALPIKDEGAYLVVCRGGDLHSSGLVLVSTLSVDVQEDAPAGRVRVTVKDVVKDDYVSDAQAKVIGSRNQEFISGSSDLRGVFTAEGIQGTSTVIAQLDSGRYAFFRGKTDLGPPPAAPNAPAADAQAPAGKGKEALRSNEQELLEQLQGGNRDIQRRQQDFLDNNYRMNNSGVKAQSAF